MRQFNFKVPARGIFLALLINVKMILVLKDGVTLLKNVCDICL